MSFCSLARKSHRRGIGKALAYFTGEQAARPNLSVFTVPVDAQAFKKLEKTIAQTIQEAERVADDAQMGMGRTMSELALQNEEEQFSGLLPCCVLASRKSRRWIPCCCSKTTRRRAQCMAHSLGWLWWRAARQTGCSFLSTTTAGIIMWRHSAWRLVKQAAQEEKGLRAAPVFGGQHRCYYKGRKAAARAGGTGCSGPCERFPVPGVEEA